MQLINEYSEIVSIVDGMLILSIEIQFSNDLGPINVAPFLKVTFCNDVHPEKQLSGTSLIFVTNTNIIQSLNTEDPKELKLFDIKLNDFKFEQFLNALFSIAESSEFNWKFISEIDEFSNALSLIVCTVVGIVSDKKLLMIDHNS